MKLFIAGAAFTALLCACAAQPTPAPAAAPKAAAAAAPTAAPKAAAAPAPAAAAAAAPASGPNATKTSSDAMICRRDSAPLASHIPQKNCHTKAEWAEIDAANAAQVDQASRAIEGSRGTQPQ